ncbi:MAG: S24 family peptidase, partial [Halothiobacillus sp.]
AIQNSESNPHPDEYAYIPLYNIEASAGHGSYVETEEVASRLAFRRDWLHQEVMANPANLHLIYVRGDSMEPALQSGEVVMVDASAAIESIRDGIHVIQIDGAVLIKRLQRLPGNRVKVTSDNTIYAAFEADLNTAEIKIIGRVIWHAGRI